jgi:hypothetical protein
VVGEHPCGQQTRDAASEHDRAPQSRGGDIRSLPCAEAGENLRRRIAQRSLLSQVLGEFAGVLRAVR